MRQKIINVYIKAMMIFILHHKIGNDFLTFQGYGFNFIFIGRFNVEIGQLKKKEGWDKI